MDYVSTEYIAFVDDDDTLANNYVETFYNEINEYPFIDVIIPTGMDHLRNSIVSQSDAIIVIGGGAGTLSEMALAWVYHRLIIALPYEGWGEKLSGKKIDERVRYKDFPDDCVWPANSPLEAVDLVSKLLPIYTRRHKTIKQREVDK